jgi:hypothetical protein
MTPLLPLALTAALLAQPGPRPPLQDGPVLTQFFQIRSARIQQSLGLPEDRARALAERWGRWDREVMDRLRLMNEVRGQFSQVLLAAVTEDDKNARLKPLLERFLELRRQQEDARRKFEEEILVGLTPAQKVRLIILVEELQPKLRGLLRESRGRGGRY